MKIPKLHLHTGVYLLRNTVNGKIYVGSASGKRGFYGRWHSGYRKKDPIGKAIAKYGWHIFTKTILVICEPSECTKYEQVFLDNFKPFVDNLIDNKAAGYNIQKFANSRLGTTQSPEARHKMSLAKLGKPSPKRGTKVSAEQLAKMRTRKGVPAANRRAIQACDVLTGETYFFESTHLAATALNAYPQHIWKCAVGKLKTHRGYYWKYVNQTSSDIDSSNSPSSSSATD